MQYGAMLWAALLGAGLSMQVGMNAAVRLHLGNALWATLVNFGVGMVALCAYTLALRAPLPGGAQAATVPWWAWLGGALGAFYVASTTVLGPRLGAATLTALVVGGQMIAALAIDHYGLVGFAEQGLTPARAAGAALIVVGVVLLTRH